MIGLLIHLLILLLVLGSVYWIVTLIMANFPGVPPVFRQVALVIFWLILLIVVLQDILPLAGLRGFGY